MDVISFGPEKPRRPLSRPPRRVVVAGLATVVCAALLVTGIGAVRGGGHTEPGTAATQPSTVAATAAAPNVPTEPAAPPCVSVLNMAAVVIGRVPQEDGTMLESCDPDAVKGPWAVVVRGPDGSLGRHGGVVTFPVARPDGGLPVKVNGAAGVVVGNSVTWPLAKAYARIRGDLGQPALLAVAERTTASGGRPQVSPPVHYKVVWSGPYRAPVIHEVRYGSDEVGEAEALGGGLTYTGVTTGGAFEDQLYLQGAVTGGFVGGTPALVSGVAGGNATLAWEPQPGIVAYIGYSGGVLDQEAVAALQRLATRSRYLNPAEWRSSRPQTVYQVNEPG